MELSILFWVQLFDSEEGIEHTENQKACTYVKTPLHRIWNNALWSCISNTYPSKENWENIARE